MQDYLHVLLELSSCNGGAESCEIFLLTLCVPLFVPIHINIHHMQLQFLNHSFISN